MCLTRLSQNKSAIPSLQIILYPSSTKCQKHMWNLWFMNLVLLG